VTVIAFDGRYLVADSANSYTDSEGMVNTRELPAMKIGRVYNELRFRDKPIIAYSCSGVVDDLNIIVDKILKAGSIEVNIKFLHEQVREPSVSIGLYLLDDKRITTLILKGSGELIRMQNDKSAHGYGGDTCFNLMTNYAMSAVEAVALTSATTNYCGLPLFVLDLKSKEKSAKEIKLSDSAISKIGDKVTKGLKRINNSFYPSVKSK
jgi:hypothetical protein